VVSIYRSVPHSWLTTEFAATRRMPLVEQELITSPEHESLSPVISGGRVVPVLVFCVFCRSLFVLLSLFCVVCPSIYGFWLPFGIYLQVLLISKGQHSKVKDSSLRRKIWSHKTNLARRFCYLSVCIKEGECAVMCVRCIDFPSVSASFLFDFGTVLRVNYFLLFILISNSLKTCFSTYKKIKKNKGIQDSIQLCFVFNTEISFELILKMCLSLRIKFDHSF
jgi:hypothetical protein